MKFQLAIVLLVAFVVSLSATAAVGGNLGGVLTPFVVAAVLVPISAAGAKVLLSIECATLATIGIILGSAILLEQGAVDGGQFGALAIALLALGCSLMGLTRGLMALRVGSSLAGAIVVTLALAWLAWPVWLSPWLTGPHANAIAAQLARVHPLLAINAVVPDYGYWIQSRVIYRLTSLGQDIPLSLPAGIGRCAIVHLLIGLIALTPGVMIDAGRRQATAGAAK